MDNQLIIKHSNTLTPPDDFVIVITWTADDGRTWNVKVTFDHKPVEAEKVVAALEEAAQRLRATLPTKI